MYLGCTYGVRCVSSLAISAQFSLILPDLQMKSRDRRNFFYKMVDFTIRKRDFRVRGWSGASWESLERKKKRGNQMYLQDLYTFAPLGLQKFAVQRNADLVNTFGFLFFSLQGLPEGSRPPTDPKIPFPYWKIDHLRNACPPIFCFNRRIRQNQLKSAVDG